MADNRLALGQALLSNLCRAVEQDLIDPDKAQAVADELGYVLHDDGKTVEAIHVDDEGDVDGMAERAAEKHRSDWAERTHGFD